MWVTPHLLFHGLLNLNINHSIWTTLLSIVTYSMLVSDITHGIIIQTGITYKKIPCYMYDSACRWFMIKNIKYFVVMLNIFELPWV